MISEFEQSRLRSPSLEVLTDHIYMYGGRRSSELTSFPWATIISRQGLGLSETLTNLKLGVASL